MTEEEFKELTESLETVGHYVPTVRDMFQFLVDRKGYFRVDPENPKAWRGYAGVKLNEGQDASDLHLDYFPEAGRFEVAIRELLSIKTLMDEGSHIPIRRSGKGLRTRASADLYQLVGTVRHYPTSRRADSRIREV
jgi:hypothetical protein